MIRIFYRAINVGILPGRLRKQESGEGATSSLDSVDFKSRDKKGVLSIRPEKWIN